ncbi:MAG: DMT family transporter [Burkholderiales bacterium]|nr:DMT family transporter [Burkholderiales bacterium]
MSVELQTAPPLRGYAYAAIVISIWTGFILVSRMGGISQLTPWDIIALRYTTAAAVLLPIWFFRGRENFFTRKYLALCMVGGLAYASFAFMGFKLTLAAHAGVLLPGTQPFLIAMLAWFVLKEKPGKSRLAGLFVIASGLVCLGFDAVHFNPQAIEGDLLMLAASLCWASYSVLLKRWKTPALNATIAVNVLTALLFLPAYLLFLPKNILEAPLQTVALQAIYQGVFATTIQMVLFVKTVALIGPTRLGTLMALIPALAGVAAVPLLNEALSPWVVLGLVLVSAGAWLSNYRFARQHQPE